VALLTFCCAMERGAVTEPDWSTRVAQIVGREIRRYRDERRMSAQQLSDTCAELGVSIERSVISNLENKRRAVISVPELLVLARALGVPPLLLAFPVGRVDQTEVLPNLPTQTWAATTWFTGEAPFPFPFAQGEADFDEGAAPLILFRKHAWTVEQLSIAERAGRIARHESLVREVAGKDDERKSWMTTADAHSQTARHFEERIQAIRADMRRLALAPPPLPADLEHLDEEPAPEGEGSSVSRSPST